MGTDAVQRVERALDIVERYHFVAGHDLPPRPWRNVTDGGNTNRLRHEVLGESTGVGDRSLRLDFPPFGPAGLRVGGTGPVIRFLQETVRLGHDCFSCSDRILSLLMFDA